MRKIVGFIAVNIITITLMSSVVLAGYTDQIPPPNFRVPEPTTLLLLGMGAGAMIVAKGVRRVIRKR